MAPTTRRAEPPPARRARARLVTGLAVATVLLATAAAFALSTRPVEPRTTQPPLTLVGRVGRDGDRPTTAPARPAPDRDDLAGHGPGADDDD